MATIDWGLVKVQYEVFGESRNSLIKEYGLSPPMLDYAIEQEGWRQLPIVAAVGDWRDLDQLEQVGDELLEEVQKRMRILRTVKQSALSPRYIALEAAILGKGLEIIQSIHPESPLAAQQLKMVTDTLAKLNEQNGVVGSKHGSDDGKTSVTVQVMGRVGNNGTPEMGAQVMINQQGASRGIPLDN